MRWPPYEMPLASVKCPPAIWWTPDDDGSGIKRGWGAEEAAVLERGGASADRRRGCDAARRLRGWRGRMASTRPLRGRRSLPRAQLSFRRSFTFGDFERTEDDNEREKRSDFRDCHRQRSACRVPGHDHEAGHRIQPRRLYKEPAQ